MLVPAARAEWSAPVAVSTGHEYITGLQLASGPGGELLAWRSEDGLGVLGRHATISASEALAPTGGSFARSAVLGWLPNETTVRESNIRRDAHGR